LGSREQSCTLIREEQNRELGTWSVRFLRFLIQNPMGSEREFCSNTVHTPALGYLLLALFMELRMDDSYRLLFGFWFAMLVEIKFI
jgi:hypothetical protein